MKKSFKERPLNEPQNHIFSLFETTFLNFLNSQIFKIDVEMIHKLVSQLYEVLSQKTFQTTWFKQFGHKNVKTQIEAIDPAKENVVFSKENLEKIDFRKLGTFDFCLKRWFTILDKFIKEDMNKQNLTLDSKLSAYQILMALSYKMALNNKKEVLLNLFFRILFYHLNIKVLSGKQKQQLIEEFHEALPVSFFNTKEFDENKVFDGIIKLWSNLKIRLEAWTKLTAEIEKGWIYLLPSEKADRDLKIWCKNETGILGLLHLDSRGEYLICSIICSKVSSGNYPEAVKIRLFELELFSKLSSSGKLLLNMSNSFYPELVEKFNTKKSGFFNHVTFKIESFQQITVITFPPNDVISANPATKKQYF